jgi:hypothetical protein
MPLGCSSTQVRVGSGCDGEPRGPHAMFFGDLNLEKETFPEGGGVLVHAGSTGLPHNGSSPESRQGVTLRETRDRLATAQLYSGPGAEMSQDRY